MYRIITPVVHDTIVDNSVRPVELALLRYDAISQMQGLKVWLDVHHQLCSMELAT